ncbi:MAG: DUF2961 domain-containing protein [Kiritimatiellae bacterium]|jgi:hypothetical protein|nr:DUF2961 domain-containing protein [Kiritimatiellia bacterium]
MNKTAQESDISIFKNEITKQLTTFDLSQKSKTIAVPRGKNITLGEISGHGYISQIWLTFPGWFWAHWNQTAHVSQTILKTLIIRMYWDGAETPAVQCPIGDFFGNGLCEISNFTSRYFGMSSGGFFCKFPMPFKKGFRFEIENCDEHIDADIFMNVLYQLTEEATMERGYFHTQFNTGRNPGPEPITVLDAQGKGHFVGCTLAAQGERKSYLSFLEAPEYVYIDDDWQKPQIVGTGLEDYFLGGWYFREGPFAGELHGVTSKDALNSSIAMYRVHELDAIRFEKRLRFEFANPWDPDKLQPFSHSSAAFYYLDRPEGQEPDIPDREDLLCWYRIKNTDHLSIP